MTSSSHNADSPRKYEPVAISIRAPVLLAVGLAVLVGSTLAGIWWLDRAWSGPVARRDMVVPAVEPPPRQWGNDAPLSAQQRQERLDYESQQQALLSTYGWIDRDAGVARIPIARAMELLQQRESTE